MTSSAVSAASASGLPGRASPRSGSARPTSSASASWRGTGPACRSTPTSAPSTAPSCVATASSPFSSAVASPARTSAWPAPPAAAARASTGRGAGCGTKWPDSSACADRVGSSLRTSLACELAGPTGSSAIWRRSTTPLGAFVVGAAHTGAPHRRQRLFLLARDISAHPARARLAVRQRFSTRRARVLPAERFGGWLAEPCVRRVDDGFPGRVDRVRSLGNAVVPAVAAAFGRSIVTIDKLV